MTIVFAVAFAVAGWVFSYLFAALQAYHFLFLWSGVALLAGGFTQYFGSNRNRRSSPEQISSEAA